MRTYLSTANLYQAAGLAVVLTLMAMGRVLHGQMPLGMYVPLTFLSMLFVAGAVTAWGRCGGMPGVLTDRRTLVRGAGLAMGLSLAALPVIHVAIDPEVREALSDPRLARTLELTFPSTLGGRLSLVLWSASFQVMLLVAAPMSVIARVTHRWQIALVFCLVLRAYVVHRQLTYAGITEGAPLFYTGALLSTVIGCGLFARFGLLPAMVFAAGLDVHVFLPPM